MVSNIFVDKVDINILAELSNGACMKELVEYISLSRSGIEKRKKILKQKFDITSNSDRDLVIRAKKYGFI